MTTPFQFGTKAETLQSLIGRTKLAAIPPLVYYSNTMWRSDPAKVLNDIRSRFEDKRLIVRSSSIAEDQAETSMAGHFLSASNIGAHDCNALKDAITAVSNSMTNAEDQILVQEEATDQVVSGVVMTFDIARGAPYYCIDFDDESGRTDTITSGIGSHKSLYIHRDTSDHHIKSKRIKSLLNLARELEFICNCTAIDIEFGIDKGGQIYLFQVRRIVLAKDWHPVIERRVRRQLFYIQKFLEDRNKPKENILGQRNIFAVMPDWNPAEIIGITPRPLAASLYMHLITDSVWSQARANMGYRDLGDSELMVMIAGHGFIDVRHSFNSLLPADVPERIGEKLVNAWLERLEENKEFHDKIEFEIVPTCLDFTFREDFHQRYPGILNDQEYQIYHSALKHLTQQSLMNEQTNSLNVAIKQSVQLDSIPAKLSYTVTPFENLRTAHRLLELCRKSGTLPFAIAARHAFISEALLRSALAKGAISEARLGSFRRSIHTKNSQMIRDLSLASTGKLAIDGFNSKYGHLRPGTYEITSLRYDERDDLFHSTMSANDADQPTTKKFALTRSEIRGINQLLEESNLNIDAEQLIRHAHSAIKAREDIKFNFTRALSDAMSHIVRWGNYHGISRDDLSFLKWNELSEVLKSPILQSSDSFFLNIAECRRRESTMAKTIKLAHMITSPQEVFVATLNKSMPNFVGAGSVSGSVIKLHANSPSRINLKNCVVCIENADPGFDWIFTKNPSALITCFGGTNSHMGVRCAELGIPAAIGCGNQIFNQVLKASVVEINCDQRIIRPSRA